VTWRRCDSVTSKSGKTKRQHPKAFAETLVRLPHMARGALPVLMRELKAAVAAGVPLRRAEIEYGKTKIVLIFGDTEAREEISEPTALDKWRANRGSR
jgi:hypothetical protein